MGTRPDVIIARFGTCEELARALSNAWSVELSAKAVRLWETRGEVPPRWHIPLLFLAGDMGVDLELDELLSMTRRGNSEPDNVGISRAAAAQEV